MATIVTRSGKGSALTHVEADANFTNLNTDKIELTDLSVGTPAAASGSGSISYDNETGVFTYTPPDIPSPGLSVFSDDTTPQLGGDLDVNDFTITTTVTDGNIVIAPIGAGVVELGGDAANGYDGAVIIKPNVSDGNGVLATETGIDMAIATDAGSGNGAYVTFAAAGGVEIVSNGATTIDGLVYPNADGTANQVITTDGSGNLSFATVSYNNLSDKPTLFDGAYSSLTGAPTLFDGAYSSLTGAPTIPSAVSDLTNDTGFITNTLSGNLNVGANQLTYNGSSSFGISFETTGMVNLGYIQSYGEMIHVESTTTSGTWAPDAANGPIQYVAMTGSMTINGFSNVSGGQTISILLDNSGGTYTLTLGADILQAGGDAETLSGGFDLLTITCVDDETPVYLAAIQAYS